MGAADRHRILVPAHDLSQKNGPVNVRNSVFHDGDILRVVRSDRRGENDEVDVGCYIFFFLADNDIDAVSSQRVCDGRSGPVRSGDLKTPAAKDLCKAAH